MDDRLASIRRAIHDEGLDVLEAKETLEPEDGRKEQAAGAAIPMTDRPVPEPPQEDNSNEIINLRSKIARELNRDLGNPPLTVVPTARPDSMAPPPRLPPAFKSLLGGEKNPSATTQATTKARPLGRGAALPNAPRRPQPVPSVPPAYESPSRPAVSFRPPFGQSSIGIRSLQSPTGTEGMISAEVSHMTASSFTRLAEQVFGREAGGRSIDDLARELLRPMLKEWLDQNLPQMVEQLVREEIERVARRGRR
jgi:cell pole-organizing protein PopZ